MIDITKLNKFKDKNVVVFGDIMLDKYTDGLVNRISPEAPVPVLKKSKDTYTLGGAANVANNLIGLGASVFLSGIIGTDENGKTLLNLLKEKKIDATLIYKDKNVVTITKNRILGNNQQLIRIDEENDIAEIPKIKVAELKNIKKIIAKSDVVVLSDYGKGYFNKKLAAQIIQLAKKLDKLILVDCKPVNKSYFIGVDVIKPNLKEAKEMTSESSISDIGSKLVKYFKSNIVLTSGGDGIYLYDKKGKSTHFSSQKVEVFDVSGAGDTVLAMLALTLASSFTLQDASYLANYAAGIVVQKQRTAAISYDDLLSVLQEDSHLDKVAIVPKLWGYEKWIENNEMYCSKLLYLKKGYQCSLHYHKIKDEMFIVTSGHVRLEVDDKVVYLRTGNFQRIKALTKHRFLGLEESTIIEVSTQHFEDDSYRIEESKKVS